jgi:hypothetical protein
MIISTGSTELKTSDHAIQIFFLESLASNPPDKIVVDDKEYNIFSGFKLKINKNQTYKIVSHDLNSYRVSQVKRVYFNTIVNKLNSAIQIFNNNSILNTLLINRMFSNLNANTIVDPLRVILLILFLIGQGGTIIVITKYVLDKFLEISFFKKYTSKTTSLYKYAYFLSIITSKIINTYISMLSQGTTNGVKWALTSFILFIILVYDLYFNHISKIFNTKVTMELIVAFILTKIVCYGLAVLLYSFGVSRGEWGLTSLKILWTIIFPFVYSRYTHKNAPKKDIFIYIYIQLISTVVSAPFLYILLITDLTNAYAK